MTERTTASRRKREFTKEGTLAKHPIILVFDMPQVKKALSWRRETCLHFADFQFLLCRNQPARGLPEEPEECPRGKECRKCRLFKKCISKGSVIWLNLIPDGIRQQLRIYRNKAHLADDLERLCSAGYLRRVARGLYERNEIVRQVGIRGLLKRDLRKLVSNCPESMIFVDNEAVFLYATKGVFDELVNGKGSIGSQVNRIADRLVEIAVKDALRDIRRAFEKELLKLTDDKKKVHLWRYLCGHVETRLASLGIHERMSDDARAIYEADLGLSKPKLRSILRELESEEMMTNDAKTKMSKAMWLDGVAETNVDKYALLMADHVFFLDEGSRGYLREGEPNIRLREAWKAKSKPLTDRARLTHPDRGMWVLHDGDAEFEIRDNGRWLLVYSKKPGKRGDVSKTHLVRQLLNEGEEFQKWFEKSGMYLSLDLRSGGPILLIGVLGS